MIAGETSATADEAKFIRDLVLEWVEKAVTEGRLPKQLDPNFWLEFGEDSSGDPAVWVWLPVKDDQRPSLADVEHAANPRDNIQKAILGSPVRFWPYVVYGQRK